MKYPKAALAALLAAVLLAACGEKTFRPDPEEGSAYNGVNAPGKLVERMHGQNEAERIGN
jgi:hypothetical protein